MKGKKGRPLKYRTVQELQNRIDAYFADCDQRMAPYTVTGLAVAVGLTRKGLLEYQGRRHFTNAIEHAKARIEVDYEERLIANKGSANGLIFVLKNNYGYQDKIEQEINSTINAISDEAMDTETWLRTYGRTDDDAADLH